MKKKFVVSSPAIRERLIAFLYDLPLDTVPEGWKVVISPHAADKSQDQIDKYHAMLDDIRKSGRFVFMGRSDWSKEDIKRLLIDAFSAVKAEAGEPLRYQQEIVPSLDGKRIVTLAPRSRDFTRAEASDFISFLYAYGSDLNVRWSEQWLDQ